MYGYVRTHTPELKVREQEYYRAIYCGLCRTMGQCTGQCSRLALSYDFTFLALIRLALEGKDVEISPRRCILHPMKKKPMADPNEPLSFCAYASAILAFYKIMDDRGDEHGHRKFKAVAATPYVKAIRRRALKAGYRELDESVKATMSAIKQLEDERVPSVDRPADLFGELTSQLLTYGLTGDPARVGRTLGRHLGRWIYLVDAIDDYEEDKAQKRYNPFDCLWQGGEMTPERRQGLSAALMTELVGVEAALDLCDPGNTDTSNLWGAVRNILYLGMPATAHKVLYPDCACHKKDQSHKTKARGRKEGSA